MSLNWDATGVANYAEIDNDKDWQLTELLIWTTVGVGMPQITAANAEEFWTRMQMWSLACGHEPLATTVAEVKRRIGLKTNASPKTKANFAQQCARQLRDRVATLKRHMQSEQQS